MSAGKNRKSFNFRSLVTFTVVLSFLVISFTGVILYLTPQGRMAHWTGWSLFMLGKEQWSAVHINTCLLFLIAASLHIYLNWRVLISYIRTKAVAGFRRKWEFATAAVVITAFVVTTLGAIPPLSLVTDWNEDIKTYWSHQVRTKGPMPHAESLPLKKLVATIDGMTVQNAMALLRTEGFEVPDASVTLEELAGQKSLSPMEVYELLNGMSLITDGTSTRHIP